MKFMFRIVMAFQVFLYRLTGGKRGGEMRGFKVLLLTTKGRKSGRTYTTPLGCFDHAEGYVIVASNAGQPANPAWFYNLKNDPHVTIQVMDKKMPVTAEVLSGEARAQAWQRVVETAPGYADYQTRTTREIPLILLRPNQ